MNDLILKHKLMMSSQCVSATVLNIDSDYTVLIKLGQVYSHYPRKNP